MLVFAVFARNFKEGQSMITPFYMLIILPAIFLQSPDLEFTTERWRLVPVVNVGLLLREAIQGSVPLLRRLDHPPLHGCLRRGSPSPSPSG
jgi:hypothetical protein